MDIHTQTHTRISSLTLVKMWDRKLIQSQVHKARGMKLSYPSSTFPSATIQEQYQQLRTQTYPEPFFSVGPPPQRRVRWALVLRSPLIVRVGESWMRARWEWKELISQSCDDSCIQDWVQWRHVKIIKEVKTLYELIRCSGSGSLSSTAAAVDQLMTSGYCLSTCVGVTAVSFLHIYLNDFLLCH